MPGRGGIVFFGYFKSEFINNSINVTWRACSPPLILNLGFLFHAPCGTLAKESKHGKIYISHRTKTGGTCRKGSVNFLGFFGSIAACTCDFNLARL